MRVKCTLPLPNIICGPWPQAPGPPPPGVVGPSSPPGVEEAEGGSIGMLQVASAARGRSGSRR